MAGVFLIAEHKDAIVQQMRLCANGAELAEEYAQITDARWGVDIFFNDTANLVLPRVFPEYRPEFGVDADIFLLIDDEYNPVYHIEIFPRESTTTFFVFHSRKRSALPRIRVRVD